MYIYAMIMLKLCIYILFIFLFYFYFIFLFLFFDENGIVFSIVLTSKPYDVHILIYVPEC